jgi:hypothetical protein
MAEGLTTLGVHNEVLEDGIIIEGGEFGGGVIRTFHDHRIAMAFSIAALRAGAEIRILDCDHVATSFPGFDALARGCRAADVRCGTRTSDRRAGDHRRRPRRRRQGYALLQPRKRCGWHMLDSGALYRVTAYAALEARVSPSDDEDSARGARPRLDLSFRPAANGLTAVLLDGADISRAMRSERCARPWRRKSRHCPPCARPCSDGSGASPSRRGWWPTVATWGRWCSPRRR